MAGKLAIALGAITQDSVTALVVAQGLGAEVPSVRVRPSGDKQAAGSTLILKPLVAGAAIAPGLDARGVKVFRVKAPVVGEVVLEASNAAHTVRCQSAPFRALPASLAAAPGGLSFVLATCVYFWPPYLKRFAATLRGSYGLGAAPSFVLLAGDNVYLDVPKPDDQLPIDVVDRYLKYFLDDGYMGARGSLPAFSTFDDHEYWNDYPERVIPVSLWLSQPEQPGFEAAAKQALELFQRSINPPPVAEAGLAYRVDISPLSLFVIDTRSARDPVDHPRQQLLPEQDLVALEAWAHTLTGPGLLVVGQPLWIDPTMSAGPVIGDHNVSFFKRQYDRICRALENAPWDILVCSGDVHYSRLLRIDTRSRRPLHEIVASPLVSIPSNLATLRQYVFGGAPDPSLEQTIDDTTRAPYAGWQANYQMGTGNGTVFALLNFKPAGAGVSVGVSFIDIRTGAPAALVPKTKLGDAALFIGATSQAQCSHANAITLGKKLL